MKFIYSNVAILDKETVETLKIRCVEELDKDPKNIVIKSSLYKLSRDNNDLNINAANVEVLITYLKRLKDLKFEVQCNHITMCHIMQLLKERKSQIVEINCLTYDDDLFHHNANYDLHYSILCNDIEKHSIYMKKNKQLIELVEFRLEEIKISSDHYIRNNQLQASELRTYKETLLDKNHKAY